MKDLGAHSVTPLVVASMLGTSIAQLFFAKQEHAKAGHNSEAGSGLLSWTLSKTSQPRKCMEEASDSG